MIVLRFLNNSASIFDSVKQLRHNAITKARTNAFDDQSCSLNSFFERKKFIKNYDFIFYS